MIDISEIVKGYILRDVKLELSEFILDVKEKAYPDDDFYFMDHFLELTKHETMYKFIIDQDYLIKYGIASSDKNHHIKKRLEALGMIENIDYCIVNEGFEYNGKNGGNRIGKRIYKLTPISFKLCLMRSKKISMNQDIDPKIYAKYYIFIEQCVYYFKDYEKQLMEIELNKNKKMISRLETMVKKLENNLGDKLNKQTEIIEEVKSINVKQSEQINKQSEQINKQSKKINKQTSKINKQTEKISKQIEIIEEVKTINIKQVEKIEELNNNIVDLKQTVINAITPIRKIYSSMQLTRDNIGMCKSLKVIRMPKRNIETGEIIENVFSYHFIYCQISNLQTSLFEKIRKWNNNSTEGVSIFKVYKITNDSLAFLQNIFKHLREVNRENNAVKINGTVKCIDIRENDENERNNIFEDVDFNINNSLNRIYDSFNITDDAKIESDRVLDGTYIRFNIDLMNLVLRENQKLTNVELNNQLINLYEEINEGVLNAFD